MKGQRLLGRGTPWEGPEVVVSWSQQGPAGLCGFSRVSEEGTSRRKDQKGIRGTNELICKTEIDPQTQKTNL